MPRRKRREGAFKFKRAHTKMQKGIVNKEAIEKLWFEREEKSVEEIVIELSDEDDEDFPLPAEQEIDSDDELPDKEDEDLGFEDGIVTYYGFIEQQKKEHEKTWTCCKYG